MRRRYEAMIDDHLASDRQMAFVSGPRQVGKTTTARACAHRKSARYYSWDDQNHRRLITTGPDAVAADAGLDTLREMPTRIVFDEIHKYARWKSFLKGFFDVHGDRCRCIVTGSARLSVYKRGSDSLMGRYFPYRMHPLSVGELTSLTQPVDPLASPRRIDRSTLDQLDHYGGFPEPFLKGDARFYNRWRRLRTEQLIREDLRDMTRIQEVGQMELLVENVRHVVGQLLNYTSLANQINVAVDTVRRWVGTLESLHVCFTIKPWHRNVAKSLRKQPKVYLWDWSLVDDEGARFENLVASHLLKAVHWWTDSGLGDFGLYYLRDKAKREVDFVVARDGSPWFLVEAKTGDRGSPSPSLSYFQAATEAPHAFQVSRNMDFVKRDCFESTTPLRVPAATLLSQLP